MKDSYFKHIRERVIHSFLLRFGGSKHDLLVECNKKTSELDPEKVIGIRALEKHLKELKEVHGWPIYSYRPDKEEIIAKNYNSALVKYPHASVDIRKIKFLGYENDFVLPNSVRADERNKINEAFTILMKFAGQPGWDWLEYIYSEGRDSLDLNSLLEQKISFEEDFSGMLTYFSKIKDALANKDVLNIERVVFQGQKEKLQKVEFHPTFLKLWRNKWYCFGIGKLGDKLQDPYVLPIDKYIKKIEYSKNIQYKKSKLNYTGEPLSTSYFRDIIGVTNVKEKSTEEIVLRFHNKEKMRRLNSKPPHQSWEVENEEKNYVDVSLNVKINAELKNLIYEFSPGVEVRKPISLRNTIKKDLKKAISYYAK